MRHAELIKKEYAEIDQNRIIIFTMKGGGALIGQLVN